MAVLVTGAGLLGSQVSAALVERGETPVLYDIVYDWKSVSTTVDTGRVKAIVGDILDLPFLIDIMKRENIDRIIHTASLLLSGVKARPYSGVKVNILGTLNILEAAKIVGAKRVVFTSSAIVMTGARDSATAPLQEDFTMRYLSQRPTSIYAITKLTAEYLGLSYQAAFGVDFAALRIGGLFGPWGAAPSGVPARLADNFVRNATLGKPVIFDDPFFTFSGVHDFVYSKDVAKACLLACFADELKTRVYNVSWGKPLTFQDFIDVTKGLFPGAEIMVKEMAKGGMSNMPANVFPYDISRARDELGYEPEFDLASAFSGYRDWLLRYYQI